MAQSPTNFSVSTAPIDVLRNNDKLKVVGQMLLARRAAGQQQIQFAILIIEHAKRVRGFFQHLASHSDRVTEFLEVKSRNSFRSWQGYHLIVNQPKEVLD